MSIILRMVHISNVNMAHGIFVFPYSIHWWKFMPRKYSVDYSILGYFRLSLLLQGKLRWDKTVVSFVLLVAV